MSDTTSHNDLQTARIALVGLIGALVTFAVIVLLQVMYYRYVSYESLREQEEPSVELAALVAKQQAILASYAWVNEQKKIAAIPIERAMELVLGETRDENPTVPPESIHRRGERGAAKRQSSGTTGGRGEGAHAK